MASSRLLYRRNPLAYPAGTKAGFDPSHPASKNMANGLGLSAVTITPGAMFNLLKGHPCGNNALNISSAINGGIGPSVTSTGGQGDSIIDIGNAAAVVSGQTMAAIIFYQTQATSAGLVCSGTVFLSGWNWYVSATGELASYTNGGSVSGIILNTDEAYFVAVSNDGSNVYHIAKSLKTGKVVTATVAGTAATDSTSFTSNGTYAVQGDSFNNQAKFPIAAASYTPAFLSLSKLRQWADDPWAFWYPNQSEMLISTPGVTPPVATVLYQLMNVG